MMYALIFTDTTKCFYMSLFKFYYLKRKFKMIVPYDHLSYEKMIAR